MKPEANGHAPRRGPWMRYLAAIVALSCLAGSGSAEVEIERRLADVESRLAEAERATAEARAGASAPAPRWSEFIGKVLVFFSFLLVTPEIADEPRLRAASKHTLGLIAVAVAFVVWFGVLCAAGAALRLWLPANVNPFVPPPLGDNLLVVDQPQPLEWVRKAIGILVLGLAVGLARVTKGLFDARVVTPGVERLARSKGLRMWFFAAGVVFFVIGNALDIGSWLRQNNIL